MILDDIVKNKKAELKRAKRILPFEGIQRLALAQPKALDFASVILGKDIRLIAEVKKASPSRGLIRNDFAPVEIAKVYASNGVAAISVLTESRYFQGSLENLKNIKLALGNQIPLLRKDFIFDPYQVYEARVYGADAILLIEAILSKVKLKELLLLSHRLGMKCLVEVHSEAELEKALNGGAEIIGINNRDLNTFKIDISTTVRLRPLIPPDKIIVSESGIKSREDIQILKDTGVNAVLIGETLIASPDISARIRELF